MCLTLILILFSPYEQPRGGGVGQVGGGRCQTFSSCYIFPVQETTGGAGQQRVKFIFRVDNQYTECEKQQKQQLL